MPWRRNLFNYNLYSLKNKPFSSTLSCPPLRSLNLMSKPPLVLTIGFTMISVLILVSLLFPIYHLPSGQVVRRFVGSPPVVPIPSSVDSLAEIDAERLDRDPIQHAILESMRSAPKHYYPQPIWFGYRDSPTKNSLSIITIVVFFAFLWLLRHKGII